MTPQARPPLGSVLNTDVKKDDSAYKGSRMTKICLNTIELPQADPVKHGVH